MNNIIKNYKKAFTMLEILMITIIIWVWLLAIIVAITKAKTITNETKQNIIATQLAKEGIEMVYQIRNTNLLKHSDYKNYCRLNRDPTESCNSIINPYRLTESNYTLTWQSLKSTFDNLNLADWIDTWDKTFALCLNWWQWVSCEWLDNQTDFWKFFRVIEWKWLYIKDTNYTWWVKIICENSWWWWTTEWIDYTCWPWTDLHPMEFQFCSRVEYTSTNNHSVEICGILTNFFE